MRRSEFPPGLSETAFEFFYWFSRFEFALKSNRYLRNSKAGAIAEPGWKNFVTTWQNGYVLSVSAQALITAAPKQQLVGEGEQIIWAPVALGDRSSDLERVVILLKTVRNNLFHGGKHGDANWDDPTRTKSLLMCGKNVIDELAEMSGLGPDYTRYY